MKKFLLLMAIVILALVPSVQAASSSYVVIVSESGESAVVLNIDGSGTVSLPMPLDVVSPEVFGGIYVQTTEGIDVFVGETKKATVTYKTSLYTSKLNETWTFGMEVPHTGSKTVVLSLPRHTEISNTIPSTTIKQTRQDKRITWEIETGITGIEATYIFGEEINAPSTIYILIAIIIIIGGGFLFWKKDSLKAPKTKESKAVSTGKENLLKALTDNESKIVNFLLENSGSMKRNKLEKSTNISKSSLASSLNNLERRNILKVDRTHTVHIVELTNWFKSL